MAKTFLSDKMTTKLRSFVHRNFLHKGLFKLKKLIINTERLSEDNYRLIINNKNYGQQLF